jgi:hypothetical protein
MRIGRRAVVNYVVATVVAGLAAVMILPPSSAFAASKVASKDGFDNSGLCDAIVAVSDETTSGSVEVFGGFSCPTGYGLWNQPVGSTIRVKIFRNGKEIIQSKKAVPTCTYIGAVRVTCSSDSHQVKYPDYPGKDSFRGEMEIVSVGGTVTLKTSTIKT